MTAIFPEKILVEFSEDASIDAPIKFHHIHIATVDQERSARLVCQNLRRRFGQARNFPGGEISWRGSGLCESRQRGRRPPRDARSITSDSK